MANGLFHALGHIHQGDAWIKVWGVPFDYYPNEEADEDGRVWRSYKVRTLDLTRRLVGDPALHVRNLSGGQYGVPDLGPDLALAEALSDEVQDGWEAIHAVVVSAKPF